MKTLLCNKDARTRFFYDYALYKFTLRYITFTNRTFFVNF